MDKNMNTKYLYSIFHYIGTFNKNITKDTTKTINPSDMTIDTYTNECVLATESDCKEFVKELLNNVDADDLLFCSSKDEGQRDVLIYNQNTKCGNWYVFYPRFEWKERDSRIFKVYLVHSEMGCYSDWCYRVEGIFSTYEKAKNYIENKKLTFYQFDKGWCESIEHGKYLYGFNREPNAEITICPTSKDNRTFEYILPDGTTADNDEFNTYYIDEYPIL